LAEGVSHVCSRFTDPLPVTKKDLKWQRGKNGKPVYRRGKWIACEGRVGRVRHVKNAAGELLAQIDHGDRAFQLHQWIECYRDHKLWPELLRPLDIASSLDVAETWYGKGVGLVTGVKSNGLFCIVSHCEEAATVFPNFLPPTHRIHGRSGSPQKHWWYMKAPVPSTTTFKDACGNVLVEILGEGCITPVPPTVCASGEPLEWQTFFPVNDPPRWPCESFEDAAKTIAACTLVARAWPEDDSQTAWANELVDCLVAAGLSPKFVAHFVSTSALVPEDSWHRIYTVVLEYAVEISPKRVAFRWNVALAVLLGKNSANLLADWLNLPLPHSCHEAAKRLHNFQLRKELLQ
jgi:hypothetical protein